MENKKKKNNISIIFIFIALIALIFLIVAGVIKDKEAENAKKEDVETTYGDEYLCIDPDVDKAFADYRMIEIAGIDNGSRSDVIFVVAINKKSNESKLFTIYRDTLMKISSEGKTYKWGGNKYQYYKCNRSFQKEGKYGSMKMLNSHLDLNIREFLGLDWTGVEFLVNEIGGIELDGAILNGKDAVSHLRERHKPGWDAGTRSHRNEDILIQVFNKIKNMDTTSAIELYDKLAPQFVTNMSRATVTDTISTLAQINVETCEGFPYEYDILWDQWDAYYYWVAKDDLMSNVIKLHKDVFGQTDYTPSARLKDINEELNAYRETLH